MAFVELSKEGWVWSAIEAAHLYKEDQHYVVRNGEIIPVDWRGTGSFQKNVEWEKGLQQFLQMKHGLKVSI
jgi:preprotein translocase subunit SecA